VSGGTDLFNGSFTTASIWGVPTTAIVQQCNAVAWNGSIWVAGGLGQRVLGYSYDGLNWLPSAFTGFSVCNAVVWNGSLWLASGLLQMQGQAQVQAQATSTDGITWTVNTNGAALGPALAARDVPVEGNPFAVSTQIALGLNAGLNQGSGAIAMGKSAGQTSQQNNAVAIGAFAGLTSQSVNSVAIGVTAGQTSQGINAVAVGIQSGKFNQGTYSVALGCAAGQTNQQRNSIAIGYRAGTNTQKGASIAIGVQAGMDTQGAECIAIGTDAAITGQESGAVAIGNLAGRTSQRANAVAIGNSSGYTNQGNNAIAIGNNAGVNNQAANSICINANGTGVENTTANSCVIVPIRNAAGTGGIVEYTTTGEVTYNSGNTVAALKALINQMVPIGCIMIWSGTIATIPTGWALCDGGGSPARPDLRNKFIVGAGNSYNVNATGGSKDAVVVSHSHTASTTSTDSGHSHTQNPKRLTGFSGGPGGYYPGLPFPETVTFETESAKANISSSTTVNSNGESGVDKNLPPYYALAYIQKVS
jgi:hypothetical protein